MYSIRSLHPRQPNTSHLLLILLQIPLKAWSLLNRALTADIGSPEAPILLKAWILAVWLEQDTDCWHCDSISRGSAQCSPLQRHLTSFKARKPVQSIGHRLPTTLLQRVPSLLKSCISATSPLYTGHTYCWYCPHLKPAILILIPLKGYISAKLAMPCLHRHHEYNDMHYGIP